MMQIRKYSKYMIIGEIDTWNETISLFCIINKQGSKLKYRPDCVGFTLSR